MERKIQRKITTFKKFYIENYLVAVTTTVKKNQTVSAEERFFKLFNNLINLYKGLKILSKIDDSLTPILQSLKPVFKTLNGSIRKNIFSTVDFKLMSKEQIINKIKGLAGSINIGLESLCGLYQDNDKMSKILNRAINKFSTPHILIERI